MERSIMSADVSEEGASRTNKVLLADVGNSRTKLALLSGVSQGMPLLERRYDLDSRDFNSDDFENWLRAAVPASATFFIASVYDTAAAQLETAISAVSATHHLLVQRQRVHFSDFPLGVKTDQPDRVGIDRLAAATAASHLVSSKNGCIVIDCGTAASVDMVASEGQFLGGAILPGPALLARSLADGTSLLPEVSSLGHAPPPPMPGMGGPPPPPGSMRPPPPLPPPFDVIVPNTESLPLVPVIGPQGLQVPVPPAPPAPTVIV